MADCSLRELAAPYALSALDAGERERFERHLAACSLCAEDVGAFSDAALALAHSSDSAEPAPELKSRILAAVAAERRGGEAQPSLAVDWRRRRTAFADPSRLWQSLRERSRMQRNLGLGLAVLAALVLAFTLVVERGPGSPSAQALLGEPVVAQVSLTSPTGAHPGRLIIGPDGKAVAELTLAPAPPGKIYEAWVMRQGRVSRAEPAGLFAGGRTVLALTRHAAKGDVVGVTLEPAGGSEAPTSSPLLTARV